MPWYHGRRIAHIVRVRRAASRRTSRGPSHLSSSMSQARGRAPGFPGEQGTPASWAASTQSRRNPAKDVRVPGRSGSQIQIRCSRAASVLVPRAASLRNPQIPFECSRFCSQLLGQYAEHQHDSLFTHWLMLQPAEFYGISTRRPALQNSMHRVSP